MFTAPGRWSSSYSALGSTSTSCAPSSRSSRRRWSSIRSGIGTMMSDLARWARRGRLSAERVAARQRERAALGVLADRPALARVDHRPAEVGHFGDGSRQVVDHEVREREGVARAAATAMDADRRLRRPRDPALTLPLPARLELDAEEPGPESPRALRVVGGKLDQPNRHDPTVRSI